MIIRFGKTKFTSISKMAIKTAMSISLHQNCLALSYRWVIYLDMIDCINSLWVAYIWQVNEYPKLAIMKRHFMIKWPGSCMAKSLGVFGHDRNICSVLDLTCWLIIEWFIATTLFRSPHKRCYSHLAVIAGCHMYVETFKG